MLGDLDLIHSAAARAPASAPAPAPTSMPAAGMMPNHLSRFSLDSNLSGASSGGGSPLSSSWGGGFTSPKASLLTRQMAGGPAAASGTAPISIPGNGAAGAGTAHGGGGEFNMFRRHSMAAGVYGSNGGAGGAAARGGGIAASVGAAPAAGADGPHRIASLARSLSKGLSASMDFR